MKYFPTLVFVVVIALIGVKNSQSVPSMPDFPEMIDEIVEVKTEVLANIDVDVTSKFRKYEICNRQKGDFIIAKSARNHTITEETPISVNLVYPAKNRKGNFITCMQINVNQSSEGKAFITSGGIGQNHVNLTILADSTKFFSYDAVFYGHRNSFNSTTVGKV